ncbi:MAG TPA: PspC domain-containing protein [Burkholderiales bacterium]|nr:PspC domain-containing protein [Burkholderiales bacterium]
MTIADEIAKLHELHSRGALSVEEFESAKARLLRGAVEPGEGPAINRLRRSRTDRWIAGVCGGLGRLTDMESWVWRMLFALGLLFGGVSIFVYLVLWIFVPREEL